ncbi:MAG: hypothetical protein EBR71_05835 [Planctomycetes bacterium]|nr:hypothetical protein [Planctomycetota bacterium]
MLGVKVEPSEFKGTEGPDQAAERLLKAAREAYAERERTYAIDFALDLTAAQLQANGQQALDQFCNWARVRYGVQWDAQSLPSNDPRELRKLLDEEARRWDDARFAERAKACLAEGRTGESIAAWFEREGLAVLNERERADADADPDTFVTARLRESQRAELTHFERWVLLQTLDNVWKDHLRAMDQIRDAIGFRAFSQKDPRIEFKKEAARLYEEMLVSVRDRVSEVAFKGRLVPQVQQRAQAAQAPAAGELPSAEPGPSPAQQAAMEAGERAGADAATPAPEVKRAPPAVVGRNEPCPCGSGKKFKSCHGARTPEVKA